MDPTQSNQSTPSPQEPPNQPQQNIASEQQVTNIAGAAHEPSVLLADEQVSGTPGGRKFKFIALFLVAFLMLMLSAGSVAAYIIAYDKVKLQNYPDIQKKVAFFVQSLPFMPKTARFLLAKTAMAYNNVTKQSFDISAAIDSTDVTSSLGLNSLDFQIKGAIDYSNPKDLKFNLDTSLTKDFNAEFRKKDKILYFKINKIPSFLLASLGLKASDFDSVLGKWISYDTTPLDTEARQRIQDQEVKSLSQQFLDENLNKYFDDEVLDKTMIERLTEDNLKMYKIEVVADNDLIDHLGEKIENDSPFQRGLSLYEGSAQSSKLSDLVKNLRWEIYIDEAQYFTRKAVATIEVEYDAENFGSPFSRTTSSFEKSTNVKIALVAKFDDFGKEVIVEAPASSISFDEFTNIVSEIVKSIYIQPL